MSIIGRGTNGYILVNLQITIWIQQCFEWFFIIASYRALFSTWGQVDLIIEKMLQYSTQ